MKARCLAGGLVLGAAVALAAGCVPQKARTAWVNPLETMEAALPQDPKDNNYILRRMEFGHLAMTLGSNVRAKPRLQEAFEQLGAERDNTAAALTTEQLKYYKGETYERAMLCCYLGMLEYEAVQYNNARIFLSRALSADAAAVVNKNTPDCYGDDFGLAYFWIGKTFARLNDADQCAIAFKKAAAKTDRKDAAKEVQQDQKACEELLKRRQEGEQWVWRTFHGAANKDLFTDGITNLAEVKATCAAPPANLPEASKDNPIVRVTDKPEEFFTPAYQADTNLTCMIETGRCPLKYLTGIEGERTEFMRCPVRLSALRVYVDGHYAGTAIEVLDLWQQAATQDRIVEKDAAQAAKGVAKYILRNMPYVGNIAGYWNVSGDVRHWTSLPGRAYLFAAKLTPGPHTIRLEMYDTAGNLLPRLTNTYYGMPVPAAGEACYVLKPCAEGDNKLPEETIKKALTAGTQPGYMWNY
jgi:tetratricopeptide (TPR) repeat protein